MEDFTIESKIHDYQVQFIENAGNTLRNEIKEGDCLIIDNNLLKLYPHYFNDILKQHDHVAIDATEKQKSYLELIPVIQFLIENGFKKNYRLIAVGGGITQDVTAFISSILFRGVDWLFFPTTLLAQGDSCIGSKSSINFGAYKNQLGGFYPPNKIFIDLSFLNSLDVSQIKSGLGEMCHYFIIAGYKDFKKFKSDYQNALSDKNILRELIARSLQIKKGYIEIDEQDRNVRQIFNYGHSFGHAIETLTDFRVPHGIAVSYGMDMANFISVKLGFISEDVRNEIKDLLQQVWEGFSIGDISVDKFKLALSKDKKNVGKELRLILNKGYGMITREALLMDDVFTTWLYEYFTKELKRDS